MVLTIALGRFFCGWVCPLGTLNNIAGRWRPAAGRSRNEPADPSAYRIKYYVLIFLGVTSLFGLQLTGVLDPLSLLIRSFALGILPLFNLAVRSVFDTRLQPEHPRGDRDLGRDLRYLQETFPLFSAASI